MLGPLAAACRPNQDAGSLDMTGPGVLTDVIALWLMKRGLRLRDVRSGGLVDGVYILPPQGLSRKDGHCTRGQDYYSKADDFLHWEYASPPAGSAANLKFRVKKLRKGDLE
jgi:hypothetical protein